MPRKKNKVETFKGFDLSKINFEAFARYFDAKIKFCVIKSSGITSGELYEKIFMFDRNARCTQEPQRIFPIGVVRHVASGISLIRVIDPPISPRFYVSDRMAAC